MLSASHRFCFLLAVMGLAAGTTAFANSIMVSPSELTLPQRQSERITATVHGADRLNVSHETCKSSDIASLSNYNWSSESSSGTGQPSTQKHTLSLTVQAKRKAGECTITFSAGSQTRTVTVRVVERQ